MCEGVECFGNHGLFVGPERERCGERGDSWVLPPLPGHLETPEHGGQAARVPAGQRWVRSGERKGQDRGKGEEGESLGTTPGLLAWAVGGLMRAPWRGLVWAWCGTSLLEEGSPTWRLCLGLWLGHLSAWALALPRRLGLRARWPQALAEPRQV